MKRPFLLLLAILFSLAVQCQNWAPINSTEQFNYSLEDSGVVTHALKVDSVQLNELDSVLYLNRVIAPCDSCIDLEIENTLNSLNFFNEGGRTWERNQPQFLGLQVTSNGESWVFSDSTVNFTIKPHEPLFSAWQFSEDTDALITEETEQMVFGELDSIKFIYLTGGQIIELSKNHGLLSFPNFEGDDEYVLRGIEERELGMILPNFHNVFDFEVGDTFLKYNYSHNSTASPGVDDYSGHRVTGISKQEVIEVLVYEDSINVTYNVLINDTISISENSATLNEDFVPISTTVSYNIGSSVQNVTYTREEYEYRNRIPLSSDNSSLSFQYQMSDDERIIQYNNGYCYIDEDYSSSNYFMKAYDINFSFEEGYIISGNEQLLQEYMYSLFWSPVVDFGSKAYSDGLGNISSSGSSYDPGYNNGSEIWPSRSSNHKSKLLAFQKANGETGGVMLTDSEVLPVSENPGSELDLEIYPNPTSESVILKSESPLVREYVIRHIQGRLITRGSFRKSTTLDVSFMEKGMYVVSVSGNNGDLLMKKLLLD